jgi:acyl transferase domain-containing protein
VAFTLQAGRKAFAHRRAVVAASREEAATALLSDKLPSRRASGDPPKVVLLFPGQGAQYVGMGSRLYESSGVFRAAVDRVHEALAGTLDVRDLLFRQGEDVLTQTRYTQPALFTVGYALATLLESLGVRPWAMIGHSVGELVAATLAGVLSVEDAAKLVCERGRLVQSVAPGSMLSVRLPADQVRPRLSPRMSVATENGPSLCVASGPTDEIEALERALVADGVVAKRLHTSHAFHSPMMDGVVDPFTEVVRRVKLEAPRTRIVSTVTGTWLSDDEARDPAYWGRPLRQRVVFNGNWIQNAIPLNAQNTSNVMQSFQNSVTSTAPVESQTYNLQNNFINGRVYLNNSRNGTELNALPAIEQRR